MVRAATNVYLKQGINVKRKHINLRSYNNVMIESKYGIEMVLVRNLS